MTPLNVNGETREVDVEPEMPLLWVLREELGLRGTKFACGKGLCGACTIHLDGRAVRSCILPVGSVGSAAITTIEGLGTPEAPHPVQRQWIEHRVPQCGYCQPGMQMAAAAFLERRRAVSDAADDPTATDASREASDAEHPASLKPVTDEELRTAITNICRCGCYERIRRAVVDASKEV